MNFPANDFQLSCPAPLPAGEKILLAHGEGARLTRRLIHNELLPAFTNPFLDGLGDGAVFSTEGGRLAVSTDSYVVSPLFFPGGDIGKLAVHGTINDLAVCGAQPLYLSLALIVEEGLPLGTFRRVIHSVRDAARACGVAIITGDTKVVPHGAADGLFVNTTGIGRLREGIELGPHRIQPGDRVLVSGTLGDHGLAILSARAKLDLASGLESDTAPLHELVAELLDLGQGVHFLRDATRGGVSAVLHEVAEQTHLSITISEKDLPLSGTTRGACEILGLDPLHVANEGKIVIIIAGEMSEMALEKLRGHPLGKRAALIGEIKSGPGQVLVRGHLGKMRVLDEPNGAPLPRIC